MNHTPQPWQILDEFGNSTKQDEIIITGWDEETGESFDIAHVIFEENVDAQANANLIAAAPDLLTALIFSLEFLEANDDGEDDVAERIHAARTAITKATTGSLLGEGGT